MVGSALTAHNEIKAGALYPLDRLADHRGPFFQQTKAKLVQQDIRDFDDNLVPPWQMHNKLQPGTLVLVRATLVSWEWKEAACTRTRKVRNVRATKSIELIAVS